MYLHILIFCAISQERFLHMVQLNTDKFQTDQFDPPEIEPSIDQFDPPIDGTQIGIITRTWLGFMAYQPLKVI